MTKNKLLATAVTAALSLSLAQQAVGAVSADLAGNDSVDDDGRASSVSVFKYSVVDADLGPVPLPSGALSGSVQPTVAFTADAPIANGAVVTVNLTGAAVDSATDSEYYLALIDAQSLHDGAGTIDTVATDVVSGSAVLSGGDSVLTFVISAAGGIPADTQAVVVRSAGGVGGGHQYNDGDTAQTPTWLVTENWMQDVTATVTAGGETSSAVVIATPSSPSFSMSVGNGARKSIDVSDTSALSPYAQAAYRYICATPDGDPSSSSIQTPVFDGRDGDQLPTVSLALADSPAVLDFSSFSTGEATATATLSGPMAAVSSIHWDLDEDGNFDADEAFTIDAGTNTATLTFDPADSGNTAVEASGGSPYFRIVFDGSTPLAEGGYALSVALTTGDFSIVASDPTLANPASTSAAGGVMCTIGGVNGARFRPNYLWARNDSWKQFIRIGVDVDAAVGDEGETSWDLYARAKQITGNDWVKITTVTADGETLLWGYQVAQAMVNAGYVAPPGLARMDVDFVLEGLGINYKYTVVNAPEQAWKLNVVSIQSSHNGERVIPVRAQVQDASTNDTVRMQ